MSVFFSLLRNNNLLLFYRPAKLCWIWFKLTVNNRRGTRSSSCEIKVVVKAPLAHSNFYILDLKHRALLQNTRLIHFGLFWFKKNIILKRFAMRFMKKNHRLINTLIGFDELNCWCFEKMFKFLVLFLACSCFCQNFKQIELKSKVQVALKKLVSPIRRKLCQLHFKASVTIS